MPRVRRTPYNPLIQSFMDKYLCTDLKELSEKTGIAYDTLRRYANINGSHQTIEAILRDSEKLGMTPEEFMRGLLGIAS